MQPLTETEVRASLINCSAEEAAQLNLPSWFHDAPWDDLDYLGWIDPKAERRAYIIADGGLVGIRLRVPHQPAAARRTTMCALCLTTRPGGGVSLMAAPRAGDAAARLNTIGTYVCNDLACSLYIRGMRSPGRGIPARETIDVRGSVLRLRANLAAFLSRVVGEEVTTARGT
ncbi:FBP C-terminal treble-clef zinc-finger [Ruaniaceae bacterium KH17]|nr:FBP C-terminal treble-clef zinc-finger [Ruaniaceae bacterium KH17]